MAQILILDDSETILKITSSILLSKGHKVTICKSAIDAIEQVKKKIFDLIITDLALPGGNNGFDFIRTCRKDSALQQVPIMIMTGQRKEKKDVDKAISVGANDFIVKPINPEIFESKVDQLLTKKIKKNVDYSILNAKGLWGAEVRIIKMTEQGLDIQSPFLVPVETKIKILSEFFKEIGIETPWVKVVHCSRSSIADGYNINVKFVDLTEKETLPIKNWIRNLNKKAG